MVHLAYKYPMTKPNFAIFPVGSLPPAPPGSLDHAAKVLQASVSLEPPLDGCTRHIVKRENVVQYWGHRWR
jgi:hypothetical protein